MSSLTRTVSARWLGAYRCDVSAGDFTIAVDEPVSVGGTNEGPQPTELLLAALSSCFTLAVAHAARKRGIELSHLGVEVTGTYDGPRFLCAGDTGRRGLRGRGQGQVAGGGRPGCAT